MPGSAARRASGRTGQEKKRVWTGTRRTRAYGSPSCRSHIPACGPGRRPYATTRQAGSNPAPQVRASQQAPPNVARHRSFEVPAEAFHLPEALATPHRNTRQSAAKASATGTGRRSKYCAYPCAARVVAAHASCCASIRASVTSVSAFHCSCEPGKMNGSSLSRHSVAYTASVCPIFIALPGA